MNPPRITVVTPSYNQARFIERTLQSVIHQEYPNLEFIVIDGGSTDGSVGIIQRYASHLAYWVSEADHGQTDALVKGFSRATGDILCYLCSDDLHEQWTLWEVAQFFMSHPQAEVVYGDSIWIDVEDRPIKPKKEHPFNWFIFVYDHDFVPQPSTFWRRSLYEKAGGLDPAFQLAMDSDLWIRFAEVAPLYHVRRVWSRMRLYPEQKNQRLRAQSNQEDLVIRRRYGIAHEPAWSRTTKKIVAKGLRVGWKVATGCYW
jgi:glycosyltransferase involved in cell wall biosynthesis